MEKSGIIRKGYSENINWYGHSLVSCFRIISLLELSFILSIVYCSIFTAQNKLILNNTQKRVRNYEGIEISTLLLAHLSQRLTSDLI